MLEIVVAFETGNRIISDFIETFILFKDKVMLKTKSTRWGHS